MKPGLPKQKTAKKGKKQKKGSNLFVPPYLRKRPQSAKKAKPLPSEWNMDTKPVKYFDVNVDPKAKKEFEKQQHEKNMKRVQSAAKTSIVVDKQLEHGKLEVGFLKTNG